MISSVISLGNVSSFSLLSGNSPGNTINATNNNIVVKGNVGYIGSQVNNLTVQDGDNPANQSLYQSAINDLNEVISNIGIQTYTTRILTDTDVGMLSPILPGTYLFESLAEFRTTLNLIGSGQYIFYFMLGLNINNPSNIYMELSEGASSSEIFFYSPFNINITNTVSSGSNSVIYGNFISDISININNTSINSGVKIDGRVLSSTGNLQVNNSIIDNSDVFCYTENCKILLSNNTYKLIRELTSKDEIKIYGIFNKYMDFNLFDDERSTKILFLGKLTLYNICPNNYPVEVTHNSKKIFVSPGHRIIINNLTYTAKNINNDINKDNKLNKVEYYHLLCDNHYIINVDGFLTETMIDCDGTYRNKFEKIF